MKLFKEHVCDPSKKDRQHVFVPRKVKRRPGRPRKAVNMNNTEVGDVGGAGNSQAGKDGEVIDNIVATYTSGLRNVARLRSTRRKKILKKAKKTYIQAAIKKKGVKPGVTELVTEIVNNVSARSRLSQNKTVLPSPKIQETTIVVSQDSPMNVVSSVSESTTVTYQKPKRKFTECYVQHPSSGFVPVKMVEQYITVQYKTSDNDGEEIHAQFPDSDFQQIQYAHVLPSGQIELPTSTYYSPFVIEAQPLTLTVSEGSTVDVTEGSVIDMPVDIVTVSTDQALVCDQEVTTSADQVTTGQVYEHSTEQDFQDSGDPEFRDPADQDYGDSVEHVYVHSGVEQNYEVIGEYQEEEETLQGSENLISSPVEILGPENM